MKFQFSIRAAVLVLTIMCVGLAAWVNAARRQQAAVKAVRDAGGRVYYEYQFAAVPPDPNAAPRAPKVLVDSLGVDYFERVTIVSFLDDLKANPVPAFPHLREFSGLKELYLWGTQLNDRDFAELADLTALEELHIEHATQISDDGFLRLHRLTRLRTVLLTNSEVGDQSAAMLANCSRLEKINLSRTQLTDKGMYTFGRLKSLKELWIQSTQVTDNGVAGIAGLSELQELDLQSTQVTADSFPYLERHLAIRRLLLPATISVEDRSRLAEKLPSCQIGPDRPLIPAR